MPRYATKNQQQRKSGHGEHCRGGLRDRALEKKPILDAGGAAENAGVRQHAGAVKAAGYAVTYTRYSKRAGAGRARQPCGIKRWT